MDFTVFNANETCWKNTRATETFGAERDVGLILVGTFRGQLEPCVVDKRKVAKCLSHNSNNLPFCGVSERVPRSVKI